MAYKHVPDELKKKAGRPRKYSRYTQHIHEYEAKANPKMVEILKKAEHSPIVQLDYRTLEYIDEYPSIAEFAEDNDATQTSISRALTRYAFPFGFIHRQELLFIRKEDYLRLKDTIKELLYDA